MTTNRQRTFVMPLTLGVWLAATVFANAQPLRRGGLETPRQQLDNLAGFRHGPDPLKVSTAPELKADAGTVLELGEFPVFRHGASLGRLTIVKTYDDEDLEREQHFRHHPNPEEAHRDNQFRQKMEHLEHRKRELQEAFQKVPDEKVRLELGKALHDLEREQAELREHAQHGEHQRHHEGGEDDEREERREQMKRVHALHEAAERLEHGGLGEMAAELHHRAEQLEREIHRAGEREADPEPVLRGLMENMEQLRGEVRELHHKLDRVLEQLEENERF